MDERTAQRQADPEASPEPQPAPPLPPPPLAEVESEGPPDVPLPWSAPLVAAAAGFVAGAIDSVLSRPTANWTAMFSVGRVSAAADQRILWGLGAGVVTLGAALADRVGPRWPRVARWACGMGLGAVVSPGALLTAPYLITTRTPADCAFLASALALMVLSRGLLGAALGVAGSARDGLFWKVPVAGLLTSILTIVVYPVVRMSLGLWPPPLDWPGRLGGLALGMLLGLVLAERLNAARRRAMDDGLTDGERAS